MGNSNAKKDREPNSTKSFTYFGWLIGWVLSYITNSVYSEETGEKAVI